VVARRTSAVGNIAPGAAAHHSTVDRSFRRSAKLRLSRRDRVARKP
jgi:hypothetical protein